MTNGQTPEERGVYETLRYTFSYAPEEEEEEVIFSRSIHFTGEKSFEYKGTINATVPFSFPFWTFLVSLPCRGNPTIRNKREKEEGYEYNPSA